MEVKSEKSQKELSDELVKIIGNILNELPKPCTEKDIKKAYHSQFKQNISKVLDEIGGKAGELTLYAFLRKKCNEVCEVITNDGVVRVHRYNCSNIENEGENDKRKSKKKANHAPTLK